MVLNLQNMFSVYNLSDYKEDIAPRTSTSIKRASAYAEVVNKTNARYKFLMEDRGWVTSKWIATHMGMSSCAVNTALKRMLRDGLVERQNSDCEARNPNAYKVLWRWAG